MPHPLHTHFLVSPHPLSLSPGHLPGHMPGQMPGQKPGHFSRFLTGIPFHIWPCTVGCWVCRSLLFLLYTDAKSDNDASCNSRVTCARGRACTCPRAVTTWAVSPTQWWGCKLGLHNGDCGPRVDVACHTYRWGCLQYRGHDTAFWTAPLRMKGLSVNLSLRTSSTL